MRLVFVLLCGALAAAGQTVTALIDNGPAANRVDILVLADGYTQAESAKFASDARSLADRMFDDEPFKEYIRYFNVRLLTSVSLESGADHPERNSYRNTAFDAAYNCGGIQRTICVNGSKVNSALAAVPPDQRDIVVVLVNDAEYGGSGGSYAVASTNASVVEVVLHEIGHSFADLADEYGGPPPPACVTTFEPPEANVTRATARDSIKWKSWIAATTPIPTNTTTPFLPGLYEGGRYCDTGLYRPTYNSKMRSLGQPFEQINTEQFVLGIYNAVDPIDSSLPAATSVGLNFGQGAAFSVNLLQPATHGLTVMWRVNGLPSGAGTTFSLPATQAPGVYTVEAVVTDGSLMVRNDTSGLLRQTRTWTVTVSNACFVLVGEFSASLSPFSGSFRVPLSAPSSACTWAASSDSAWLTVNPNSGSGTGQVDVQYAANTGLTARKGTLTIAGRSFVLEQPPEPCVFTATTPPVSAPSGAGTTVASFTGPSQCTWKAITYDPWMTLQVNTGKGSGSISISLTANNGVVRTGTIYIENARVTVVQAAAPGCTVSLTPGSAAAPADATSGKFDAIVSTSSCAWTAKSSHWWLQVYPIGGAGSASLNYTVFPNFSTVARTAMITVGDKQFSVTQQPGTGTADERFVGLLYFNYFGRLPSASETAFWLNTKQSRPVMALNFLNSAEFNNAGRYVAGLYVGILNRDAEFGGWLFQRNALATGQTNPDQQAATFLNGPEFVSRNGALSNAELTRLLYRQILGREATSAEVTWREGLLSGGMSRVTLARDLLNSPEFRQGKNARLLAFLLYATLLNREPGPTEFAARRDQITADPSDANIQGMIGDFVNSGEFGAQLQ